MTKYFHLLICLSCCIGLQLMQTPTQGETNVEGWGFDVYGAVDVPDGTYTEVSAGYSFALGLRADGTIAAWGSDEFNTGVLDCPTGTFTSVSADPYGAWAAGLRTDGTIAAWGDDMYGQLEVPSGTFISVSADGYFGSALRSDGTAVLWGSGSELEYSGPFTALAGGVGLRPDGTVQDLGDPYTPSGTFTTISAGPGYTIGARSNGGGIYAWGSPPVGGPMTGSFMAVAGGSGACAALRNDGTMVVWDCSGVPEAPPGTFTSVSCGDGYILAIQAVPEPSSLLALVCGIAGMGGIVFRRRG
jgi:hypothetical protein